MARYIDADLLLERIYPYNGVDKSKYTINAKAVHEAIRQAPTADVVPKSEVARIFEEIEKLHLHITNEFDLRRYEELKKKYTGETNDDSDGI